MWMRFSVHTGGATTERRSPRHSGPGQYRSVAMPRTCKTTLCGLRVVLCDRLGIRYNAGQMVRDRQAHTSCQSESALAGEGDRAFLSPSATCTPILFLQERAAIFIFIL